MSSLRHVQMKTTKLNAWALKHLEYIRPEQEQARVGDDVCVAPGRG